MSLACNRKFSIPDFNRTSKIEGKWEKGICLILKGWALKNSLLFLFKKEVLWYWFKGILQA